MNVILALQKAIEILEKQQLSTPVLDAGVLLSCLLNVDRSYLYINREKELAADIAEKFFNMVEKRAEGMPVQYLTGKQEFMSLMFKVNENVLIPRPDTEILVEEVIRQAKTKSGPEGKISIPDDKWISQGSKCIISAGKCRILDIGTGSGCIAISLAHYIPNSIVFAVDISEGALETAAENARLNGVADRITFIKRDLFPDKCNLHLNVNNTFPPFDIIVSNPPYIPSKDIGTLQTEVRKYEPIGALDGGMDGLRFYRRIINEAPRYLKNGGLLALEIGYHQKEDVTEIIKKQGCYSDIRCLKDYASLDRVITAAHHATKL